MMPRFGYALSAGVVLAASAGVSPVLGDVINADFETMTNTVGALPNGYGYWRGDDSVITGAWQDITPFEGQQMLRFVHTTPNGPSQSVGSEVWQIIDVRDAMDLIRSGNAVANISAWFNRVGFLQNGELIDTMFSVGLYAYAGDPASFPGQWHNNELDQSFSILFSDGDVETWEVGDVQLNVPELTDFLVVRINATEDVYNDVEGNEFAGHFVDALTFNLVPAPPAVIGLLPALFLGRRKRRN